jgi:hypothetical protein
MRSKGYMSSNNLPLINYKKLKSPVEGHTKSP